MNKNEFYGIKKVTEVGFRVLTPKCPCCGNYKFIFYKDVYRGEKPHIECCCDKCGYSCFVIFVSQSMVSENMRSANKESESDLMKGGVMVEYE